MRLMQLARHGAHPRRSLGPLLEVPLAGVAIGELCEVYQHWRDPAPRAWAQVIGFNAEVALLSLLCEAQGFSKRISRYWQQMPGNHQILIRIAGASSLRLCSVRAWSRFSRVLVCKRPR